MKDHHSMDPCTPRNGITVAKVLIAIAGAMLVCGSYANASAADSGGAVEDIYVVRSLRLSRVAATGFCAAARTGLGEMNTEDSYNFQSVRTNTSDGAVTDANVETVGTLHACFGATSDPEKFSFYAEGALGGKAFIGRGDCLMARQNFPEEGLLLFRCFLDLSGLPEDYVGGHLTTNTVTSKRSIGDISDPPGYVQPSIATIRLWKKRGGN
jgi:hypothetical protein